MLTLTEGEIYLQAIGEYLKERAVNLKEGNDGKSKPRSVNKNRREKGKSKRNENSKEAQLKLESISGGNHDYGDVFGDVERAILKHLITKGNASSSFRMNLNQTMCIIRKSIDPFALRLEILRANLKDETLSLTSTQGRNLT